ncbi:MAG: TonB-dependent receptor [Pseudomonadales bacterium]
MRLETGLRPLSLVVAACLAAPLGAETGYLEEIVVTAQHRPETALEVPISMAVFGEDVIDELAIDSSADVAGFTPGFTVSNAGGAGVPVYTLRGVGFDDHQPNSSATVGIYEDQVAVPYPVMTTGLKHDLERIEVLKGPQGDLYGRNTTGGAVNLVSRRPTDRPGMGVSLGAGNYETLDLKGFVSGPIGERVNGRLAAAGRQRNEGWQENELTGDVAGRYDEYSVRGLLAFAPAESVDVLLTLHTERFDGEPQTPQSTVVLPASNQQAAFLNGLGFYPLASLDPLMVSEASDTSAARWDRDPEQTARRTGGSLIVDWRFAGMTLTSVTGYDDFDRQIDLDWDGTPARLLEVDADTGIESWSQELRLASADDQPLTWLAGLYYSSDRVDDVSNYDDSESPTVGFTFGSRSTQKTESAAVFGNARWQLAPEWRLNVGGRYTREDRSIENCTTDTGDGSAVTALLTFQALGMFTLTNPEALVPGGCVHLAGTGTSSNPPAPDVMIPGVHEDDIDTGRATGRIGLDWLPAEDWLVYGSLAGGFKSGGYNTFSALVVDQFEPYDEETLAAVEVGVKGRLFEKRLGVTAAAFHYDYQDKQVSTFIPDQLGIFPGLVGIQNVPESRITGVEIGADWLLTESLTVAVSASFLDTEIRDYDAAFDVFNQTVFDARGQPLPNAPEASYQLASSYERPLPGAMLMRVSLAYTYQSETYSQISAIEPFEVDAYGLLDARLTLAAASGKWSVSLWGANLADEAYWYANALAQDNIVRYTGLPRTYGLVFDYTLN